MFELTVAVVAVAIGLATIGSFVGAIALSELLLVYAGCAAAVLISDIFGSV